MKHCGTQELKTERLGLLNGRLLGGVIWGVWHWPLSLQHQQLQEPVRCKAESEYHAQHGPHHAGKQ